MSRENLARAVVVALFLPWVSQAAATYRQGVGNSVSIGLAGPAHRQHLLRAVPLARQPDLYLDRPGGRGPHPEHAHVGTSGNIISRRRRRVEIRPG